MARGSRSTPRETSVEWLSITELATMLGVSEDFIRAQVHQRRIPYYKVSKLIRFNPVDVMEWLGGLRVEAFEPARQAIVRQPKR